MGKQTGETGEVGIYQRLGGGVHTESVEVTHQIIGAAIEVHRVLGPGLFESTYEECLCYEFTNLGLSFERQVFLPLAYESATLAKGYKLD